jgi:long-chain acyl-CoA synthetase
VQIDALPVVLAERRSLEDEIAGKTLLEEFRATVKRTPDAEALKWKEGERWLSLTWLQYADAVREVAGGLRAIGFHPGDFALIHSRNRPECMISDLAVLTAGGVPVILYNTLAAEQIEYIGNHCQATVAFLEDSSFSARLVSIRGEMPHLKQVVLFDSGAGDDGSALTFNTLRAHGRGDLERTPEFPKVKPDDLATVIYTSGTTGPPKGVMHTHHSILYSVASLRRISPLETFGPGLCYLPLAHVGARLMDFWVPTVVGTSVAFCPDPTLLAQYLRDVRPGALFGVPRVWEKLHSGLSAALGGEPDPAKREAVQRAMKAGVEAVRERQRGASVPAEIGADAERAVQIGHMLLEKLGLERCQLGVSGGAPIDPAILEFFAALSLPMIEAWGMSELAVGTSSSAPDARLGTVGKAVPGVELSIADDGELMLRGPLVMKGYLRAPEQSAETLDSDGWLHTGDIATIDPDGYVRIVDRKKELIITAGGKNISPANVEFLLKSHPLIGQACVIGDRRPYLTALLVLDAEMAPMWARKHGLEGSSLAELSASPEVLSEVKRAVAETNEHLARVEQIKRFRLLPTDWTAETGELTPTLKLRRRFIAERYHSEIEAIYADVEAGDPAT